MKRLISHDPSVTKTVIEMTTRTTAPGCPVTEDNWNMAYQIVLTIAQTDMIEWKLNNLTGRYAL